MEIIRAPSKTPEENKVKSNPIITSRLERNRRRSECQD